MTRRNIHHLRLERRRQSLGGGVDKIENDTPKGSTQRYRNVAGGKGTFNELEQAGSAVVPDFGMEKKQVEWYGHQLRKASGRTQVFVYAYDFTAHGKQ